MKHGNNGNPVSEIGPATALRLQSGGAVLIDIRGPEELIDGTPMGAVNIPVERLVADGGGQHSELVLICATGRRSLEVAATLCTDPHARVYSVAGGYEAWRHAGLPVDRTGLLDEISTDRYRRQLVLPGVGIAGQRKLQAGSVLVIGAGGLGSPVLTYLAAAGVGRLGIVDDDRVDRSNLQRQIIHRDDRLGVLKTESARLTLAAINPDIQIEIHSERVTEANVGTLLADYGVIVDGSDNLATRYLLNEHCVAMGLPLVYGAVLRYEGQVSVFWPGRDHGPCYQCLFPDRDCDMEAPSCAEAGVLGVTPAVVGSLQATEVIKILLETGTLLTGRLLSYDALKASFRETRIPADPSCIICSASTPS